MNEYTDRLLAAAVEAVRKEVEKDVLKKFTDEGILFGVPFKAWLEIKREADTLALPVEKLVPYLKQQARNPLFILQPVLHRGMIFDHDCARTIRRTTTRTS